MRGRNITITVPEALAEWARVYAAEQEVSLSRLVVNLLESIRRDTEGYEQVTVHTHFSGIYCRQDA